MLAKVHKVFRAQKGASSINRFIERIRQKVAVARQQFASAILRDGISRHNKG